jgi:hypothetical protein
MSTDSKTISEECSAIGFYGTDPGAKAIESFYRTVVQWFTELGYPPDKVGVTGSGHSAKLISFARGDAKLRKAGFDGIRAIEVISSTPNALTGHGYFLEAAYDGKADRSHAEVVARSSLATLSATSMLPLARTLAEEVKPAYGFGYRRAHRDGPEVYMLGIGYGGEILSGEAYEEACNMARWGDIAMPKQVYREGLLRDVYPWNFLTRPQLTRKVGKVTLEQWIRQDARRGKLSALCDGVSFWEVVEANIPDVRHELRQAGVIFDWRTYEDAEAEDSSP